MMLGQRHWLYYGLGSCLVEAISAALDIEVRLLGNRLIGTSQLAARHMHRGIRY